MQHANDDQQQVINIPNLVVDINDNGTMWISGRTYDYKEVLKQGGGIWDFQRSKWIVPAGFNMDTLLQVNNRIDADIARGALKLIKHTNSFKVKEQLKESGGYWDLRLKGWIVPCDLDEETGEYHCRFDESTIPPDDREYNEDGIAIRRPPHCTWCGTAGHKKNTCLCEHCGLRGVHNPIICPTLNKKYKFIPTSCSCSPYGVCVVCNKACCKQADVTNNKVGCNEHGYVDVA